MGNYAGRHSLQQAKVSICFVLAPVLDAAALPYDIFTPTSTTSIRTDIRRRIHSLQRGLPPPIEGEPEPELPLDSGIIAIGREAWKDLLLGINDGLCAPALTREEEEYERDWAAAEDARRIAKENGRPFVEKLRVKPSPLPVTDHPVSEIELPPIAYIPYRAWSGWRHFPRRIINFFVSRHDAKKAGEAALAPCFGQTRNFEKDDELSGYFGLPGTEDVEGRIGLNSGVVDRLKVFVLPAKQQVAEGVKAE